MTAVLRRAAALMRERAEAATPGPWGADDGYVHGQGLLVAEARGSIANGEAQHIASWHPAVALAVAEWLDATADNAGAIGYDGPGQAGSPHAAALAVARAYVSGERSRVVMYWKCLGEDS